MVNAGRHPRPHWQALLAHVGKLSPATLDRRAQFVHDAIASDGVSYNVYADPKGASRPWELDLLPLILPAEEWSAIAAGVAQRARLLDAVLADLYGPQRLLAEGLLPPALVFGQRSFLWPANGIVQPGGVAMHVYAADLARAPDGRWWILADRTGGPSGAGYALQNRMTISRALPDAFRELHVEQLAPFFSALQDTLYRNAPVDKGESPLAVLLTPGPYNETYFEHSFLARYLGFPLVEGQDLVVRGDRVYLKTLRGLRRVHGILRRLDGDFCDPVELRADSALGVPGLLHAIRAGNVLLANAVGSAVLESGAFTGFYPAVNQALFGEPLAMPSIATWWCGEAPALDYVVRHLEELVIKPAYPTIRAEPIFGHLLDAAGRERIIERMHGQPHAYVAQEWVRLSQAPIWGREAARPLARAASLRVFAVATPNGYTVMPGGLTRVAPQEGGDVVSMQWGGSSKDTWILADKPVTRIALRRPRLGVEDVAASAVDIASRVGENLFWMGRYAERCEAVARLLRAALVRIADAGDEELRALETLRAVSDRLEVLPPMSADGAEAAERFDHDAPESERHAPDFLAAAVDPSVPGGLVANVLRLHASASQVRERMSTDNWHVYNGLTRRLPGKDATLGAALESLDEVMMACVSLAGFALDDMTRDESWQFLPLGRRIERLVHLAGVVKHVLALPAAARTDALEWLLEAANSIVTFRARYRRAPELLPVIHLVVLDDTNPHSVAFQLRRGANEADGELAELKGDRVRVGVVEHDEVDDGQELRSAAVPGAEGDDA
ncbi:MAG TPA: circularly permuted type 2 ATP-grasp protein, partial [Gaiellaceae bacterium]|nr:circularly permuted type 2 ATP-grasp protein [Gaiellaceae bacterium]